MAFDFKKFPELNNSQFQFYYWDSPHRQITESFDAHVVKVTDGDSIRVSWSGRDFDFPIRLSNINAPELNAGGAESKSWLESQIDNEDVRIIIDPENRVGKFGRILGEVIHQGINIGEASMQQGHAKEF